MFAFLRSGFAAPATQTFDLSNVFRNAGEKVEAAFDNFNGAESHWRDSQRCWICRKVTRLALRIEWRVDFHAAVKPPMIATFGRYLFQKLAFCFDAI